VLKKDEEAAGKDDTDPIQSEAINKWWMTARDPWPCRTVLYHCLGPQH
jgi:hypothetical protein